MTDIPVFDLDDFVAAVRRAIAGHDAVPAVRALMQNAFEYPESIRTAMAGYDGEETILYEDDNVSIQYNGFFPGNHVPPHDHQTDVIIGVYEGGETNHFYRVTERGLERTASRQVAPGDVMPMGPQAIHSVETTNAVPSRGIHVYFARLCETERWLYDWSTGEAFPFTDEHYDRLKIYASG